MDKLCWWHAAPPTPVYDPTTYYLAGAMALAAVGTCVYLAMRYFKRIEEARLLRNRKYHTRRLIREENYAPMSSAVVEDYQEYPVILRQYLMYRRRSRTRQGTAYDKVDWC